MTLHANGLTDDTYDSVFGKDKKDVEIARLQAELDEANNKYRAAEFWNKWVYPEGAMPLDIQNELADFRMVMERVPEVYMHITGGKLSKVEYDASVVIAEADEYQNKIIQEAIDDETEDLKAQLDAANLALAGARDALEMAPHSDLCEVEIYQRDLFNGHTINHPSEPVCDCFKQVLSTLPTPAKAPDLTRIAACAKAAVVHLDTYPDCACNVCQATEALTPEDHAWVDKQSLPPSDSTERVGGA